MTGQKSKLVSGPFKPARLCVWLTITLQTSLPVLGAFTPLIAASSENHAVSASTVTRPYVLGVGESVSSVAEKFHLSLDELRTLNRFRTFAHGFDALIPGDELEVPATVLTWEDAPAPPPQNQDKQSEARVAGVASQLGNTLSQQNSSAAATQLAGDMAAGAASAELQQWLNQLGHASVQLGLNQHFALENSRFDFLLPLRDREDSMLFSQSSLHRSDGRTQANQGLGLRWFSNDYMLGLNTFLDYDLSREHARIGMGGEYWRDYLKLSANGYQRLTNWKNSRDFEDYEERPANGWDLRMEGYLPAWPQLGARLVYEQYYGNEVALFDKNSRQKNPHAITAGLSYTPFPLMTLSVDRQQGKSGSGETRLGLDFSYRPGIPLNAQLDPASVALQRTLAGSRYDFVNRNNDIVLEYRKKQVIRLSTLDQLQGYAGEKKSLGVSVTSKYPFDHISWDAAGLIAHGGRIVQDGPMNFSVILPQYQSGNAASNTYTISALAYDSKGNTSSRETTTIHVTQAAVSAENSRFTPPQSTLTADGHASTTLTLAVLDGNNQPVDVAADEIEIAATGQSKEKPNAGISKLQKTATGTFTMTVTASTRAETLTLTPTVRGSTLAAAKVSVTAGEIDTSKSAINITPAQIVADGEQQATLTFSARDANDNPVTGLGDVSFTTTGTAVTLSAIQEQEPGVYRASLTGTTAGNVTVVPQVNGSALSALEGQLSLIAGNLNVQQSSLSVNKTAITTDDTDGATITFVSKDKQGNPITGQSVDFTTSLAGSQITGVTDNGDGSWSARISGTRSGTATIGVRQNGSPVDGLSASLAITAGAVSADNSTFAVTPATITADGAQQATLTFTAHDAHDNPVTGLTNVSFSPSGTAVTLSEVQESAAGVYRAMLTGTKAGSVTVVPQVSGSATGTLQGEVTLVAGALSSAKSTLTLSKSTLNADETAGSTITFKARDAQDNPVTGLNIDFTSSLANSQITGLSETTPGTWTAKVAGTKSGTATINVKSAGSAVSGLSTSLKIEAGAWDQSQSASSLISYSYPGTCGPNGDTYARRTIKISIASLLDKHGNAIDGGKVDLDRGGGYFYSPDGSTHWFDGLSQKDHSAPGSITWINSQNDGYSSQSECEANRFVRGELTITITKVTDGLGNIYNTNLSVDTH